MLGDHPSGARLVFSVAAVPTQMTFNEVDYLFSPPPELPS